MKMTVGLIGGTGFEALLREGERVKIKTPYGEVLGVEGRANGVYVIFIPRHGFKHEVPPHKVNYRANMYAFRKRGALKVISTCAAGSINPIMKPGELVIIDQFIDFTKARSYTYYDDRAVHVDFTEPYSPILRRILIKNAKKLGLKIWERGCYVCTEGPRFETKAEIMMFRLLGADVVGMTNVPEVILARELGISYATVVIISNFAAGIQKEVSHEEVYEVVKAKEKAVRELIYASLPEIERAERDKICAKMDKTVEEFMSKQ